MKNMIARTILFVLPAFLFSCAFAPVNNQYEKAGTLKKGNLELAGSLTGYSFVVPGDGTTANTNYGFRAGYGISDRFDLKLRYERLIPSNNFSVEDISGIITDINFFSLVPKIALIPEKLSFLVPISHYSYKTEIDEQVSKASLN